MGIPPYLNCKSTEITHCDFYINKDCPETCGFSRDIKGSSIEVICDNNLVDKIKEGDKV